MNALPPSPAACLAALEATLSLAAKLAHEVRRALADAEPLAPPAAGAPLMTIAEVAAKLDVSYDTARRLAIRHGLGPPKIYGKRHVYRARLRAFLEQAEQ